VPATAEDRIHVAIALVVALRQRIQRPRLLDKNPHSLYRADFFEMAPEGVFLRSLRAASRHVPRSFAYVACVARAQMRACGGTSGHGHAYRRDHACDCGEWKVDHPCAIR